MPERSPADVHLHLPRPMALFLSNVLLSTEAHMRLMKAGVPADQVAELRAYVEHGINTASRYDSDRMPLPRPIGTSAPWPGMPTCPTCTAPAGHPCLSMRGLNGRDRHERPLRNPHRERMMLHTDWKGGQAGPADGGTRVGRLPGGDVVESGR